MILSRPREWPLCFFGIFICRLWWKATFSSVQYSKENDNNTSSTEKQQEAIGTKRNSTLYLVYITINNATKSIPINCFIVMSGCLKSEPWMCIRAAVFKIHLNKTHQRRRQNCKYVEMVLVASTTLSSLWGNKIRTIGLHGPQRYNVCINLNSVSPPRKRGGQVLIGHST